MKANWASLIRANVFGYCLVLAGAAGAHTLPSHGFMAYVPPSAQKTHLIAIQQGSALSREVSSLRGGGYELSNGDLIRFSRWYKTHWQDLQLTWLTELNPQLGFIWGVGTGERGPKYRIDPSMQLGFLFQQPLGKQSAWSVQATTRLGGRLKERTCIADYGDIGGIQTVNCRLAATELPPEETLRFLLNEAPRDRLVFAVRYVKQF